MPRPNRRFSGARKGLEGIGLGNGPQKPVTALRGFRRGGCQGRQRWQVQYRCDPQRFYRLCQWTLWLPRHGPARRRSLGCARSVWRAILWQLVRSLDPVLCEPIADFAPQVWRRATAHRHRCFETAAQIGRDGVGPWHRPALAETKPERKSILTV